MDQFKESQLPPPPPYRNNLYKITYVINFSRYSLKIRGGGVQSPLIYLPQVQGGGVATRPPPTLLLWRPWHMRIYPFIYSFIVFVYVFINSFIQLFIHSQVFQSISVQIRCTCQGRPQDLGGGGGQEFFFSDLGICMSRSDMLRMAKPCALLGGFGGMLPREIF